MGLIVCAARQLKYKSASGHKIVFFRSLKAFIWDSSRLEFEAARLVVIVINIINVSVRVNKTGDLNCIMRGKRGILLTWRKCFQITLKTRFVQCSVLS